MKSFSKQLFAKNLNDLQHTAMDSRLIKYFYMCFLLLGIISLMLSRESIDWIDLSLASRPELIQPGTVFKGSSITRKIAKLMYLFVPPSTLSFFQVCSILIGIMSIQISITSLIIFVPIVPRVRGLIVIILVCYSAIFLMTNQIYLRFLMCKNFDIAVSQEVS